MGSSLPLEFRWLIVTGADDQPCSFSEKTALQSSQMRGVLTLAPLQVASES